MGQDIQMKNGKSKDRKSMLQETPPDGGWGWVVTFSAFMTGVILDGISFSFGVFFPHLQAYFNESKSLTAWVISAMNGTYLGIAPIASMLVTRFGCRRVAMCGAALAAVSFFLCTFSPNVQTMIILYGLLGGTGLGLFYLPPIISVSHYFKTKRALATGMALCGSGIGSFIFAPLSEYLIEQYTWKGAVWILSGVVLNGVVVAALLRPLAPHRRTKLAQTELKTVSELVHDTENSGDNCVPVREMPRTEITQDHESQGLVGNMYIQPLESQRNVGNMSSHSVESQGTVCNGHISQSLESQRILSNESSQTLESHRTVGNMSSQSLESQGNVGNMSSQSLSSIEDTPEVTSEEKGERNRKVSCVSADEPAGCCDLEAVFDFSLLRSPTFLVYGSSCFLSTLGLFIPFTYIPSLAQDMGLTLQQGAMLISIIGIVNTCARVGTGWLADRQWANSLIINNAAAVVGGVATIFVSMYNSFGLLATYSVVFGIYLGVFVSLRSTLMIELLGIEKLASSFGLVVLCQGLSSFVGAPLAGALADMSGDYKGTFYLAGGAITLSGLICFPLRRIASWENRRLNQEHSITIYTSAVDQEIEVNGVSLSEKINQSKDMSEWDWA